MGTKWTDQEQRNRMTRTDLGLAALVGASAATALMGVSLTLWGPQPLTIQPCSEDGVLTTRTPSCLPITGSKPCDQTLYDGTCGHPDVDSFHDGYWWPASTPDAGTIAPLQLKKGDMK